MTNLQKGQIVKIKNDLIWTYMRENALSVSAFAKRIGISATTLSKILHNGFDRHFTTICKIAFGMDKQLTELIEPKYLTKP